MINAQKKNAQGETGPSKPQLKLLTCVVWMSSVKSTGKFKHHKRNHEREVIQSDVTNRVAHTVIVLCCLRNCRNLLLLSTGTPFLLQSVSEHRGEMGR